MALALAGCYTTTSEDATGSIPSDYRQRHPIALGESKRTLDLYFGAGRGGLTAMQRAEVTAFAQNWKREATGGITIDRPTGGANERAALDTLKEVLSIVVAVGVPNDGIGIRPYQIAAGQQATLRLNYPLISAQAGQCGYWPDDIGATYDNQRVENKTYWNYGCAYQRNLASMVDNPADLVQPRSEGPAYAGKRAFSTDKWRKGQSPATTYPDASKGAISDIGK